MWGLGRGTRTPDHASHSDGVIARNPGSSHVRDSVVSISFWPHKQVKTGLRSFLSIFPFNQIWLGNVTRFIQGLISKQLSRVTQDVYGHSCWVDDRRIIYRITRRRVYFPQMGKYLPVA